MYIINWVWQIKGNLKLGRLTILQGINNIQQLPAQNL